MQGGITKGKELKAGINPVWTRDYSGWRGIGVKREEPKHRVDIPTGVPGREGWHGQ